MKVQALERIVEEGVPYNPGDVFEVTPERAKALGSIVGKVGSLETESVEEVQENRSMKRSRRVRTR